MTNGWIVGLGVVVFLLSLNIARDPSDTLYWILGLICWIVGIILVYYGLSSKKEKKEK